MTRTCFKHILMTVVLLVLFKPQEAVAQRFKVEGFRMLTNDVTAFIDPVKDLNDNDCALIKVQAGPDFVFSTPLGIIKRIDNVGEILLYIPRGSKKITIKHPTWGVLRDYNFPAKIESHITYELKIAGPRSATATAGAVRPDLIPVVTTIRDTLVVTHTDTLVIRPVARKYPLTFTVGAGVAYGGNSGTLAGSILLAAMKKHGGFIHLSTDCGHVGPTIGDCDRNGYTIDGLPFYSGHKRHSFLMVTAGGAHRLSERITLIEGIGYATNTVAWELARSEGGGYLRNRHYTHHGLTLEAGAIIDIKRIGIHASVATVKGRQWYGSIGLSIRLGR